MKTYRLQNNNKALIADLHWINPEDPAHINAAQEWLDSIIKNNDILIRSHYFNKNTCFEEQEYYVYFIAPKDGFSAKIEVYKQENKVICEEW